MRITLIFIFFFLLNSCEYDFQIDRKISVDEFINEELKSFNWNEVDQYPVFENCLELNDVSQKNKCFVETITNNFTANLKKNNLVLNRTLVDTVNMVLMVDKKGLISVESINISKKNPYYGEYTFHYWIWKNYLNHLGDSWIGFCQYRKFWSYNEKKIIT